MNSVLQLSQRTRVTIYGDPIKRMAVEGVAVPVEFKHVVEIRDGIEVQCWLVWFPKTNTFAERNIAAVPSGSEEELETVRQWVRDRADRWEAATKRHNPTLAQPWVTDHEPDPYHVRACRTVEIDYLKKLQTAVSTAIEKLEKAIK